MRTRADVPHTGTPVEVRPAADRRRSQRLKLLGEIHGNHVGLEVPLEVRDISRDGFSVVSPIRFPDGDEQLFELASTHPVGHVILRARAARCTPAPDRPGSFLTGFAFAAEQPLATRAELDHWLDEVIEALRGTPLADASPRDAERRRLPRLEVLGEVYGEVEGVEVHFIVRDLSHGGLCIETHSRLVPGSRHSVWLQLRDHLTLTVDVRVTYCRDQSERDRPRFLVGLEFGHDPESRRAAAALLDQFTAALVFE